MPVTITTAGEALLRDVLLTPDDDAPRLILADWLGDHGEEARAEFIRVQCALAGWPCECDSGDRVYHPECRCKEKFALRRRGRELLTPPHFWDWFGDAIPHPFPGMAAVKIKGTRCEVGYWDGHSYVEPLHWWLDVRRGFVKSVRLPCQDFLTHAAALFAAQPVTRVELGDREARVGLPGGGCWVYWCRQPPYSGDAPHDLPAVLWDAMVGRDVVGGQRGYPGAAEARAALSAACVAWGRGQAGLGPGGG